MLCLESKEIKMYFTSAMNGAIRVILLACNETSLYDLGVDMTPQDISMTTFVMASTLAIL